MTDVLSIENLKVEFTTDRAKILAVDGINLALERNQTLGLVGESGCGKSVTALAVMGLLPHYASVEGNIMFNGRNLLKKSEREMTGIRGNYISMIFQEPMTSLNPVFTIEDQLAEVLKMHQRSEKKLIRPRIIELLSLVGIPNPERRMKDYPHQLSGGMRQRVMIAMALACEPEILIADEPTTALDVTIQAQILVLMKNLQQKLGTGLLIITHDLGVIAQVAHRVAVMYAGQVMEYAGVMDLFGNPLHPYTRGLLKTIPNMAQAKERLEEIKGMVPQLTNLPRGCRFQDRCTEKISRCSEEIPPMVQVEDRSVRCWLHV